MNENLFNELFDRKTHSLDFLRGRVASCIWNISYDMLYSPKSTYNETFYNSVIKYNNLIIKEYGLEFLNSTKIDIIHLRKFFLNLLFTEDVSSYLRSINYENMLRNYIRITEHMGYSKRSKVLRRYKNFITISSNFINEKITFVDYTIEVLNHFKFFNNYANIIKKVEPHYICIYYMVYDINISDTLRRLKKISG